MAARFQHHPTAPPTVALAARAGAILLALLTAALLLTIAGAHPLELGRQIVKSTFGSRFGLEDLGLLVTPLIFTGLSVSVALSIGAWNIGAEGQFYAGAFAATGVGLYWHAPAPLMLPLMFVAGALGGAAWILAPTLARAYAGVSELITTLLLNFVALLLVYGVATAPWLDPGGHALGTTAYRGDVDLGGDRGAVRPLADAARLRDGGDRRQGLFRHAGAGGVRPGPIPYLKDLPILMHFLLFRRRLGLDIRAVGENPAAADATGVPVTRLRFWCVSLGVALAAGAGAYLTLAFVPSWSEGVVAGRGWIAVSLVIFAGYRPINAVLAALLFGLITSLGFVGQARNWPFAPTILSMLPYLGAIAFIILPALASGKLRRLMAAPPRSASPISAIRDSRRPSRASTTSNCSRPSTTQSARSQTARFSCATMSSSASGRRPN